MFGKLLVLTLLVVVGWTGFVRPSEANTPQRTYAVRSGDTLWAVAAKHYPGDPREGVWRLREENGLAGSTIRPGQLLRLP